MAIAVNNTTKIVTISGTSEASPETIASVIDSIIAVDAANASRTFNTGWLGGTWQITFATFTDFLIITAGFTLELRATAAFQMVGSFILDEGCTLIVARSSGLGFSNLATFQNSACKLVTRRQSQTVNPKVIIDCQGTQRSDFFGSANTTVTPTHNIQGIDLIFRSANSGSVKAYFSSSAIAENFNLISASNTLQFFSNSTSEIGCPVFTGALFTSNAISGDNASEPRYIRLKRSKHLSSGSISNNNRATYLVLVDPEFTQGIPTAYGASSGGNYQSGLDVRYTYNISVFNEVASPIANTSIRFKRSDGFTTNLTTNSSGSIAEQELLYRQAPSVAATSRVAGTLSTFTWEVKGRSYGHLQSTETYSSGAITTPQVRSVTMITDPNISLTNAEALALAGISFNFTSKKITMTGQSAGNLYHYYKAVISNPAQFDVNQFMVIAGGTLSISDEWSLDIDGGTITGNSAINNILVSGTFSLLNSASNSIPVTDGTKTYYPAVTITGYPTNSVLGIKNNRTGVWVTLTPSGPSVSASLSNLGVTGDTFTVVGDAFGYQRTSPITIPITYQGTYDVSPLFIPRLDSTGSPICGNGIQAEMDRIVYNPSAQTIELAAGAISFNSFCDKLESIFNTSASIADWDSDVIRGLIFDRNPYASTVQIPAPIKINAAAGATQSPVLTDFIAIESGNPTGDPFGHIGVEVRVLRTKILKNENELLDQLTPNLALIPACIK
jgi:hypothetical protein